LQKLLKNSYKKISNKKKAIKQKLQIQIKRLKKMLKQDNFNKSASKFDATKEKVK
jgi:hypothetical protein